MARAVLLLGRRALGPRSRPPLRLSHADPGNLRQRLGGARPDPRTGNGARRNPGTRGTRARPRVLVHDAGDRDARARGPHCRRRHGRRDPGRGRRCPDGRDRQLPCHAGSGNGNAHRDRGRHGVLDARGDPGRRTRCRGRRLHPFRRSDGDRTARRRPNRLPLRRRRWASGPVDLPVRRNHRHRPLAPPQRRRRARHMAALPARRASSDVGRRRPDLAPARGRPSEESLSVGGSRHLGLLPVGPLLGFPLPALRFERARVRSDPGSAAIPARAPSPRYGAPASRRGVHARDPHLRSARRGRGHRHLRLVDRRRRPGRAPRLRGCQRAEARSRPWYAG